jgi:ribosomal-protein-alanine N-acetyltransferase
MLSLDFSPFPELETARLYLKQMTPGDAPALFELRSNPRVMQYIDRPLATKVDDASALIQLVIGMLEKNDAITWGIFSKEEPALKGTIGFWRIQKEHYRAEIGYLLHPQLQGRGLMQEAITAVLHYGFSTMKLHSVEANIKPGNIASEKLLLRNGFVQEGYFRENYFYNGVFGDSQVFSLLAPKVFPA